MNVKSQKVELEKPFMLLSKKISLLQIILSALKLECMHGDGPVQLDQVDYDHEGGHDHA